MILAVLLSLALFVGWQFVMDKYFPAPEAPIASQSAPASAQNAAGNAPEADPGSRRRSRKNTATAQAA